MATPLEILKARRLAIDNMAQQNVANQSTPQNRLGANIMNLGVDLLGGFKDPQQQAYDTYQETNKDYNAAQQAQGGGAFTAPYKPDYNPQADMSGMSGELRQAARAEQDMKGAVFTPEGMMSLARTAFQNGDSNKAQEYLSYSKALTPSANEGFSLSEGGIRFDASGKEIARNTKTKNEDDLFSGSNITALLKDFTTQSVNAWRKDNNSELIPRKSPNGEDGAKTSAYKQMQELMAQGMDRDTAQKIAYNTSKTVTDPITGDTVLVDERQVINPSNGDSNVILKGNKLPLKLEADVKDFGATVEKAKISDMDGLLNLIDKEVLSQPDDFDIPGYGQTSFMPAIALSDDGKRVRQLVNTVQNTVLKDRSGAAVTVPEFERLKLELSTGKVTTDAQIRNAMGRLKAIFENHKQNIAAGYPREVVDAYSKNSSIKFNSNEDNSEGVKVGRFTVKAK